MSQGDKRALITGLTGFVGPYLARSLLSSGYDVFGLARPRADGSKPKRLVETGLMNRVKIIQGDVTDLTSLIFAVDRCDPEVIFHLASQSYVPRSFAEPLETFRVNCYGTQNLLEAVRLKGLDCKVIFAGSSEEYGLQIASKNHYEWALKKYGVVEPEPKKIPELPVREDNFLRPLSPYAVSKMCGDYLMRNYYQAYGLKTIVSRAFNHEGAGRGHEFVTSTIVRQCVSVKQGESEGVVIGDVNVFRDWSHVEDIVRGYILLAEKGLLGSVYVQGSMRTNSVLSYILLTLESIGYQVKEIETLRGEKKVGNPTELNHDKYFGVSFEKTFVDKLMLDGELNYSLEDKGLAVDTDKGIIPIKFDPQRFRPADVPILMSGTERAQGLGFRAERTLRDIIRDQVNYYLNPDNRRI